MLTIFGKQQQWQYTRALGINRSAQLYLTGKLTVVKMKDVNSKDASYA